MTLEEESRFLDDYWSFRKKYRDGNDFVGLCEEADVIAGKYNNDIYAQMLLCVCANDIEARYYASKGRPVDSHLQLERAMKLYDTFVKRRRNDNGKSEM